MLLQRFNKPNSYSGWCIRFGIRPAEMTSRDRDFSQALQVLRRTVSYIRHDKPLLHCFHPTTHSNSVNKLAFVE